jgi:hypothetical protein
LKGERKEGEGSLGCVDSEGDVKNQDKVGWFIRKVQRSWFHACQKKFEEHDDLVQYIQYCVPNNRWKIPMLNYMNGGSWQRHNFEKKCKRI